MTGPVHRLLGVTALSVLGAAFCAGSPVVLDAARAQAVAPSPLSAVKSLSCSFRIQAMGTWVAGVPKVDVAPAKRPVSLSFDDIDVDSGTANSSGAFVGVAISVPIIVQRIAGALQFTQVLRAGPLYATTVFEQESAPGKFKAVHSRHEVSAIAVPGFTWTPEQYYGECVAAR